MCFQVYLGSSHECTEIPYSESWEHIYSHKLTEHSGYTGHLSLESPYRYHLGVMSCGCGFTYDTPVGEMDESTQTFHRQLGEYVEQCLRDAESVELFSVWSGDEFLPIEKHRWITLDDLFTPEFYFEERQLTIIYKDRSSLQAAKGAIHSIDSDG